MKTHPKTTLSLGDNMDKQTLRKMFLKERQKLSLPQHRMLNHLLMEGLIELLKTRPIKNIGIFYPIKNEVDVRALGSDYKLHYPKVEKDTLVFYEDNGQFKKAGLGVMEPKDSRPVEKASLDAVIVPGLVFDDALYRLGYGKGYYDSFLKDYKGLKIGVCFEKFRTEALPNKPHDIPMDYLITDNQVYVSRHDDV